jgi:Tfp pilus assembly protein PilO
MRVLIYTYVLIPILTTVLILALGIALAGERDYDQELRQRQRENRIVDEIQRAHREEQAELEDLQNRLERAELERLAPQPRRCWGLDCLPSWDGK